MLNNSYPTKYQILVCLRIYKTKKQVKSYIYIHINVCNSKSRNSTTIRMLDSKHIQLKTLIHPIAHPITVGHMNCSVINDK